MAWDIINAGRHYGFFNFFNEPISTSISRKNIQRNRYLTGFRLHNPFNSQNLTLQPELVEPLSSGLSDSVLVAIAKAPQWIQPRLTSQFQTLDDPESYVEILLNASKKIADEIAFSIACSPIGRVPSATLLKENAESLYEHDQWIDYADIVEFDNRMGNYSSTIRYKALENGVERHTILPPEIYYWYVVHPEITNEDSRCGIRVLMA